VFRQNRSSKAINQTREEEEYEIYRLCVFLISFYVFLSPKIVCADISYNILALQDTSYANVTRGCIRIRIGHDVIPSENEFRKIAKEVWKTRKGKWQTGSIFFYVKDMPANSVAYAVAEFNNYSLGKFWIDTKALELSEYMKEQKRETKEEKVDKKEDLFEKSELKVGMQYILTKRTPLMPAPKPEKGIDGLISSLKQGIVLQSSNFILVTTIKNIDSVLWYQVIAYREDGSSIGSGWINNMALVGQDLRTR
jgi:hypothetical protein